MILGITILVFIDGMILRNKEVAVSGGFEVEYTDAEKQILSLMERVNFKNLSKNDCLLYTSPSPRDRQKSRMPSSA